MHDGELKHIVESFENLDGEPFGQCHWEPLEIIVLNELVQVDAKHLKAYEYMTSECERVFYPYDVLRILVILVPKRLQNLYLNLTLFMQFLPVFQYLQGNYLFALMVKAPDNDTEGSFAKFLLNLIPVINLFLCFIQIVSLVVVESVVEYGRLVIARIRVLILTIDFALYELAHAFVLGI